MRDLLTIGALGWAVAATIALVHQHLRADNAVAALFRSDERNDQLTGRLTARPVSWRHPRREVTRGQRTSPTATPRALPAPPPAIERSPARHITPIDWATVAPFPDPPPPVWDAVAAYIAGSEAA